MNWVIPAAIGAVVGVLSACAAGWYWAVRNFERWW